MESKMELDNAMNEVCRKIGRNMLLLQQMELILKHLISNSKISGYADELRSNHDIKNKAIQTQTLGQVVGQYLENIYSANEDSLDEPGNLEKVFISTRFRVKVDAAQHEAKKKILASIVSERNDLIHKLLLRIDTESIENLMEVEEYLDLQREKLLTELHELQIIYDTVNQEIIALSKFLKSDEGKKHFKLSWLRETPLVILLEKTASQCARPDGWAVLDTAAYLIRQSAPEEIAILKKRYGYKTLKALITATEIFELIEESTHRGGSRLLYRLKPDAKLQKISTNDL